MFPSPVLLRKISENIKNRQHVYQERTTWKATKLHLKMFAIRFTLQKFSA
jgi:hypothetical protein